ncbi:hypothetical protein TA3x_003340 [Tundrisphaera sp. TA3]|uniref:hypothetical protein n=1 Tax=Tundrisphaera sp. TA3 TaxID=3435775 RepID=UPI003EC08B62
MDRSTVGAAPIIKGYAWHAYADPATPGVMAGDNPFGDEEPPALDRAPVDPPEGVLGLWLLNKNTPGIQDQTDGHTYLIVTSKHDRPEVVSGWFVEPAHLDASFQIDQRGDRWVRLVRFVGSARVDGGSVHECEFQIDRA